MMPAADHTPLTPNGAKSDRLSEFQPCRPSTTNSASTPSLISTMTAFTFADSLAPRISSSVQSTIRMTAGMLRMPPCSGACDERRRDVEAEQVVQQLVEVLRPADGDRCGRHAVLEQQTRGDDHRDALAQRRVGVRVRRAGDGHRARELGVADRGEAGHGAGDDEREDHRGPGDRDGLRQHDEDAGADRRADAEQRELEQPDRPGELALARVARRSRPSIAITFLRRRTCSRRDAIALSSSLDVPGEQVVPGLAADDEARRRRPPRTPRGCAGFRCSCWPS